MRKTTNMDSQIRGTEGEKFVNQLAYSTFFKYWCYPSPKLENSNKKEICDLLIIFRDIVLIFSVKNYEFKGNCMSSNQFGLFFLNR